MFQQECRYGILMCLWTGNANGHSEHVTVKLMGQRRHQNQETQDTITFKVVAGVNIERIREIVTQTHTNTEMKLFFAITLLFIAVGYVHSVSTYRQVPGGLTHSTASTNYLWGVNSAHNIYKCERPCTGGWVQVPGGLVQVDASDDEVWGVNVHDHIYKRPVDGSGQWTRVSGGLKHVSASGNGYIWGVNRDDHIYKCKKPCNGNWVLVSGHLKQIDGGERYVYGVNRDNSVFARPVDGSGSWRLIPGKKLKHVTASGATNIYGVDTQNYIYSCPKPCVGEYVLLDGRLSQVDGSFNAFVGVNSGHNIFVRKTDI